MKPYSLGKDELCRMVGRTVEVAQSQIGLSRYSISFSHKQSSPFRRRPAVAHTRQPKENYELLTADMLVATESSFGVN